jgi:phosphate transport system substrate-binding protein
MKVKVLMSGLVTAVLGMSATVSLGDAVTVTGAGASFPDPIYQKWASKYQTMSGMKLNYQPIGSGGGIAQIKARTVDFGASDAPLKDKDLKQFGLVQFPMVIGGVVPIVNIKGIAPGQMKLTGQVLADIFLGKITKWNDEAIKGLNKELTLPDQAITVVHRADGSGTTWLFTNYLDKVSRTWHEKVGTDKMVPWPVGMGGKGNAGVAANVKNFNGSIGYVEYAFARQNKMTFTQMRNKAGKFVSPTIKSFQAAAASADWQKAAGYYVVLTDQAGDETWPITGASFILMYREQKDGDHARAILKFFDWSYNHGAQMAEKLDYVPIPKKVYDLVEETWKNEMKAGSSPVWP